ncbi:MAG: hypothetical protein HZC54_20580 [Verrucomicrobia bacterium]|nr:hypothetical protein [Verrucomicrobiota bacterium]
MAKSDYINPNDLAFLAQLRTFKNNVGNYAALLGVSPAQVAAQAADTDYFAHVVACHQAMQNNAQQWTAWKKLTRGGGISPESGAPVAAVLPAAVPAVPPGIEARFRALVKQIKANANYNTSIGDALGIEGAQQAAPDLAAIQPIIELELSGGQIIIHWGWGGYSAWLDMIEIQVDRGDGKGYVLLAHDTTPGYTDTTPLPTTPAKWKYKAIYRVGDQRVGVWSQEVAITVGG